MVVVDFREKERRSFEIPPRTQFREPSTSTSLLHQRYLDLRLLAWGDGWEEPRSSENPLHAKFAEQPFHALG